MIILIIDASQTKLSISVMALDILTVGELVIIPELFKKLREYKDVFSIKEVGRLSLYKGRNYTIKTTLEPPFGLLYNLSNTKLAALRSYLNNALVKG